MRSEKVLRHENMLAKEVNANPQIVLCRIKQVFFVFRAIDQTLNDLPGQHGFALPSDFSAHDLFIPRGLPNGRITPHPCDIFRQNGTQFSLGIL